MENKTRNATIKSMRERIRVVEQKMADYKIELSEIQEVIKKLEE